MQLPMFAPTSNWRPPKMSDLPSWKGFKRISIDCETRDDFLTKLGPGVRRGGYIVGIGFTIEDTGQTFYLPYRHQGGDNLPVEEVLSYMRQNAAIFTGELVGANIPYDLDYLESDGIVFPLMGLVRDIQIADPLIYELHKSFSLKNIGLRYGVEAKDETMLAEAAKAYGVSPKGGLWQLPARFVGAYGEQDTVSPLEILKKQEAVIKKEGLEQIWDLESKVLPVLLKMRRRGVRIDMDKLEYIENWSTDEEYKALSIVKDHTGWDIGLNNIWKADSLVPALEFIGIKINKTKTGKPNIDKDVLANIDHPVATAIARARKVNKLRTTFAASIRRYQVNGRIHCTLNQIAREDEKGDMAGARYGRLSCKDPNLQQQPSRDEFASMWRSIYIPEEGGIWGCCDYSQQEPRWTTHFATVMKLKGAAEASKRYRDDPTTDNHQMMADMTGLARKPAKDVFLGLCYGEGGAKLSDDLGLPTRWALRRGRGDIIYFETKQETMEARYDFEGEAYMWRAAGVEAQGILNEFDIKVPFVRKLASEAQKKAKQRGWIKTIGGRKLHFPDQGNGQYDWTHKALNRIIQGSSADQTKTALVEIDRLMPDTFINLQVHDEIDGSFGSEKEAKQVGEIMRDCVKSEHVPFMVDVEIGPNWGEIK